MSAISEKNQLDLWTKFAYGVGQAGDGIKISAFGVFLFFYYNQVLALSGTYSGLAVGIALMFDAITDPLVGSLSDNWRSRLGRRHPFMYTSALPLAIAFYFLFSPPTGLGQLGLFLWLLTFAILTRGAMTLFLVPYLALGAELTSNYEERTAVAASRQFFFTLGNLSVYAIGFGLFFYETIDFPQGQFRASAYGPFALVCGLMMIVSIFISAWGTRAHVHRLVQPTGPSEQINILRILIRMLNEIGQALKNRSFTWLFVGVLILFMMVGVDSALNLHMNTFFWELSSQQNIAFFTAFAVGALVGTMFTRKLNEVFDKKPSIVFSTSWWALCQVLPVALRFLGWFPENGTSSLLWTLVGIKLLQGVGVVQGLITLFSMMADIIDEQELATGKRQEGIFFASLSFSGKFTIGMGNLVGGFALDLIRWPRGPQIQTAADVPPETLVWLSLIYGPIISCFTVVSVWCFTKYNLNRERYAEIVKKLAIRRRLETD